MKTSTNHYIGNFSMTGLLSTEYHRKDGVMLGSKVLVFVTQCPDAQKAQESVDRLHHHFQEVYGTTFDHYTNKSIPVTKIIRYRDLQKIKIKFENDSFSIVEALNKYNIEG